MKKLVNKKILLWTFGILGVVVIGFLVTMNYATDYLLRSIVASSEVQNHSSEAVKKNVQQTNTSTSDSKQVTNPAANQASPGTNSPSAIGSTTAQSEASRQQPVDSVPDTQKPDSKGSPSPSMPYGSDQTASTQTGTSVDKKGYDGNITPEKVEQAQESVTLKEKTLVSSILLKKLSPSDISLFVKMSGDGVTTEEKKQAKEMILKKLSEEEYNELIAIAAKLGLSQGKNFKESQKEFQTN